MKSDIHSINPEAQPGHDQYSQLNKEPLQKKEKQKSHIKLWEKFLIFGFLGILLLTISTVAGFEAYYSNKVYPGVYVLGEKASGKNKSELTQLVDKKLSQPIILKVNDKNLSFSANNVGIFYKKDEIINRAFDFGRQKSPLANGNIKAKIITLFKGYKIDPLFSFDERQFNEFTAKLVEQYNTSAQKASLQVVGEEIQVNPAAYASEIAAKKLEQQIKENAKNLFSDIISISFNQVAPPVLEDQLKEAKARAESWLKTVILLKKDDKSYIPSATQKGGWLTFTETGEGKDLKVVAQLDQEKVKGYFNSIAAAHNIPASPKKVTIENGIKETVTEEGKEGTALDINTPLSVILKAFEDKKESLVMELAMYTILPQTIVTRVTTYDCGSAPKCIVVNLSQQRLYAYENGGQVFTDLISSGKSGYATPTGTFTIYNKTLVQDYEGGRQSYDYYKLINVRWSSWFNGDRSIHEAYWHNNFGTPMSRGCINARASSAEWIYNWAPIGTPVIVLY